MGDLIVKKRDGMDEDWSDDKIIASIGKAGLDITKAEALSESIKSYFINLKREKITSSEIRDKVIIELAAVDQVSCEAYRNYKENN